MRFAAVFALVAGFMRLGADAQAPPTTHPMRHLLSRQIRMETPTRCVPICDTNGALYVYATCRMPHMDECGSVCSTSNWSLFRTCMQCMVEEEPDLLRGQLESVNNYFENVRDQCSDLGMTLPSISVTASTVARPAVATLDRSDTVLLDADGLTADEVSPVRDYDLRSAASRVSVVVGGLVVLPAALAVGWVL